MNAKLVWLFTLPALVILFTSRAEGAAKDKRGCNPVGLLEVYTGTKTYNSGDILYFPHTSYAIHHSDGRFYRYVRNHTTPTDEVPFRIPIPAGSYDILARSENEGRVKIPVTVNPGRLLIIRLDNPNRRRLPSDCEAIRLTNGSVVGWHWSRRAPEEGAFINLFGWKI